MAPWGEWGESVVFVCHFQLFSQNSGGIFIRTFLCAPMDSGLVLLFPAIPIWMEPSSWWLEHGFIQLFLFPKLPIKSLNSADICCGELKKITWLLRMVVMWSFASWNSEGGKNLVQGWKEPKRTGHLFLLWVPMIILWYKIGRETACTEIVLFKLPSYRIFLFLQPAAQRVVQVILSHWILCIY